MLRHFNAPFGFVGTDGGGGSGDGGQGGTGGTGGSGSGSGDGGQGGSGGANLPKSQADLDRIVEDRLNQERKKYADHDELKRKASEFDKIQQRDQTELQKSQTKVAEQERAIADRDHSIQELKVRGGITSAATKKNFHNPDDAYKLVDLAAVDFDNEGNATNLDKLVEKLAESRPHLVSGSGGAGSADGGSHGETRSGDDPTNYREHVKNLPRI